MRNRRTPEQIEAMAQGQRSTQRGLTWIVYTILTVMQLLFLAATVTAQGEYFPQADIDRQLEIRRMQAAGCELTGQYGDLPIWDCRARDDGGAVLDAIVALQRQADDLALARLIGTRRAAVANAERERLRQERQVTMATAGAFGVVSIAAVIWAFSRGRRRRNIRDRDFVA